MEVGQIAPYNFAVVSTPHKFKIGVRRAIDPRWISAGCYDYRGISSDAGVKAYRPAVLLLAFANAFVVNRHLVIASCINFSYHKLYDSFMGPAWVAPAFD